jgi:hypothetical protein
MRSILVYRRNWNRIEKEREREREREREEERERNGKRGEVTFEKFLSSNGILFYFVPRFVFSHIQDP